MPLRKKIINSVLDTLNLETVNCSKCKIATAEVPARRWNANLEFRRNLGNLSVDLGEIYIKMVEIAEREKETDKVCKVDNLPSKEIHEQTFHDR